LKSSSSSGGAADVRFVSGVGEVGAGFGALTGSVSVGVLPFVPLFFVVRCLVGEVLLFRPGVLRGGVGLRQARPSVPFRAAVQWPLRAAWLLRGCDLLESVVVS